MIPSGWEICGPVDVAADSAITVRAITPPSDGSERGLVTVAPHRDRMLSFDVYLPSDACFIAKINQTSKLDQQANSYHLYCDRGGGYLARHCCVFKMLDITRDAWVRLHLGYHSGRLEIYESGRLLHGVRDVVLPEGYAFVGVKRGHVRLRGIELALASEPSPTTALTVARGDVVCRSALDRVPRVSIVTTVYDRVECLADCIRSVRRLEYTDYEHVIVSDCPPPAVVDRIAELVRGTCDPRISYTNLPTRYNNWGIAPAAVGLRQARGRYVCFLSDDNGYTPDHVGMLVGELDTDRSLGFVYSSCRYAGIMTLRHPHPAPGRIDLGQPLFRRELFTAHLSDDLPFQMIAWDWAMIDTFLKRGVRCKHIDVASFIFRMTQYPQLMVTP
jgi:Glycosyl transferase family 2